MNRPLVLTILGLTSSVFNPGCSQAPDLADSSRPRRRDRNPYFAARPVYPPAPPGARANVTFEPYTRWYYPSENTYYPPLDETPMIPSR